MTEESKREAKKVEDAYLHIEVTGCGTTEVVEKDTFPVMAIFFFYRCNYVSECLYRSRDLEKKYALK